jgi:Ulp1 family protease
MLIPLFSVPWQPNYNDCGVFCCRFGYGLYRLRHHEFTYREVGYPVNEETIDLVSSSDKNDKEREDQADSATHGADGQKPFEELITDNPLFSFAGPDIIRLRAEMSRLLENLSTRYMPLQDGINKREAAASKKKKRKKRTREIEKRRELSINRQPREEVGLHAAGGTRNKSSAEFLLIAQEKDRKQSEKHAEDETRRAQAQARSVQSPPSREERQCKRRKQRPLSSNRYVDDEAVDEDGEDGEDDDAEEDSSFYSA